VEPKSDLRSVRADVAQECEINYLLRQPVVQRVAINLLLPADSPRLNGEDERHIRRLAQTEDPLPAILVRRETMRVIDGMHRLRAAILRGCQDIEVIFFDGSDAEAFIRAVEVNMLHGLPLSLADRRAAAGRIISSHPELSDRAIAARVGLSARTVRAVRARSTADFSQSNGRVGADGRLRPLNSANARKLAARVLAASPDAPLREVARIAGVSVSTAHDVRQRVSQGRSPIPVRYEERANDADRPADEGKLSRRREGGPSRRRVSGMRRNCMAILHACEKDPSLRHTQSGRELLRWLNSHVVLREDWLEIIDSVPAHCVDPLVELAHQCAQSWYQFAREIERR